MLVAGETERLLPDPTKAPPQDAVYHLNVVPDPPLKVKSVVEPLQMVVLVADAELAAEGRGLTSKVAVFEVALAQLPVTTQE